MTPSITTSEKRPSRRPLTVHAYPSTEVTDIRGFPLMAGSHQESVKGRSVSSLEAVAESCGARGQESSGHLVANKADWPGDAT
jgi:hypothetical protein